MDDRAEGEAGKTSLDRRHAARRLTEAANRGSRPDRLLVLDCRGRGCRRRLGKLDTRPGRGQVTPDGEILPDRFPDGPVFTIFGPFEVTPESSTEEYRLRGKQESVTAPTVGFPLRRHRSLASRARRPNGVPIEPGVKVVIVCGCGYRNEIDLGALAAAGELARSAGDPG